MIERRPKIIINGDRVIASAYLRVARYEMDLLEQDMARNNIEIGQRNPKVVSATGVTVQVKKRFGDRFITIDVPAGVGGIKKPERICLCNCNFTVGWIVRQQEDVIDGALLYTVMSCEYKRNFTRHEDVLASDWTKYLPGQTVLLVPYHRMAYLCCEDRRMLYGEDLGYGCRGIRSEEDKDDEEWRTVYRIIPYMARFIPRWIEVQNGPV